MGESRGTGVPAIAIPLSHHTHQCPISREFAVCCQQDQGFAEALRDEQTIKRVFVVIELRELRDRVCVAA